MGRYEGINHALDNDGYFVNIWKRGDDILAELSDTEGVKGIAVVSDNLIIDSQGMGENELYIGEGDPRMPSQYEEPELGIEAYGRFVLDHGDSAGIDMDLQWDFMDEENLSVV